MLSIKEVENALPVPGVETEQQAHAGTVLTRHHGQIDGEIDAVRLDGSAHGQHQAGTEWGHVWSYAELEALGPAHAQ